MTTNTMGPAPEDFSYGASERGIAARQAAQLKRIADSLEALVIHLEHFGAKPHPSLG